MLYGETNVNLESLKTWSASLSMTQTEYKPRDSFYDILSVQLQAFQQIISSLAPDDDWRDALHAISPLFQNCFFRTPQGAIHLANYYECFLIPADIETKKKIIKGYGITEEIGEVILYDGTQVVGNIGEKSDLLWSTFIDYFVVEPFSGDVIHTLPNHEEFLSLQLYNTEHKNEQEILEYINQTLLTISIEEGLNFKRSRPIELWKNPGAAGAYQVQISGHKSEAIPLAYLNYGIACNDSRMAFLHFYQVLEYFFVRAQNANLMTELNGSGVLTSTSYDDNTLRRILKTYSGTLREVESLKLVLQKAVDIQVLKQYINSDSEKINQYTMDTSISDRILINLSAADMKIINKLAERIYFFRCAIAHAKGDVDEYLALPDISDTVIQKELPLLKDISYKALQVWGK